MYIYHNKYIYINILHTFIKNPHYGCLNRHSLHVIYEDIPHFPDRSRISAPACVSKLAKGTQRPQAQHGDILNSTVASRCKWQVDVSSQEK